MIPSWPHAQQTSSQILLNKYLTTVLDTILTFIWVNRERKKPSEVLTLMHKDTVKASVFQKWRNFKAACYLQGMLAVDRPLHFSLKPCCCWSGSPPVCDLLEPTDPIQKKNIKQHFNKISIMFSSTGVQGQRVQPVLKEREIYLKLELELKTNWSCDTAL